MKKIIKRISWGIGIIVSVLILMAGSIIGYAYFTEFSPEDIEDININFGTDNQKLIINHPYTMTTLNVGYGGLGKEQDFFMDSGKNSGALSLSEVENNMQAITQFVQNQDSDFLLLQEVDISGKRSYDVNQLAMLSDAQYSVAFGKNYDVKFVPVPFTKPMGGAISGIATMAKSQPTQSQRFTFAGKEPFVKQLFDLHRCFTITRYQTDSGKELVLINAHFSAFDKGGSVRGQQLAQMKQVLIDEQQKGNYVILGGDFNHELPGTNSYNFQWEGDYPKWCFVLPDDFTPAHFNWATDGTSPTVRSSNTPYLEGISFVATIDGFLVSDNIQIEYVKTHGELNFEHTDHNPVELKFTLL